MFWLFNRTTNFAYMRYDMISGDIRKVVDEWEMARLAEVEQIDKRVEGLSARRLRRTLTDYSVVTAQTLFDRWTELNNYLLIKYVDGNVKAVDDKGNFVQSETGKDIPDKIKFVGYSEKWKRAVAADNGEILKVVK